MSQITTFNKTAGPGSGTVTSVSAGHDIFITGNPAVNPTVNVTNAITLGDLSVITAGNPALTAVSGDITISGTGTNAAGNLNLPGTTSANKGVITVGGNRFIHDYGSGNVFMGGGAGNFTLNTGVATQNIGIGQSVLDDLTTGFNNVGIGTGVMDHVTTANSNVAVGYEALNQLDQSGGGPFDSNVCIGDHAGFNLEQGSDNTLIGAFAGDGLDGAGSNNIVIGSDAGHDLVDGNSNNIIIGSPAANYNNVIRIGESGSGAFQQNRTFIAGIAGVTTSNSQFVTINTTTGQLGSTAGGGGSVTIDGDVSSVTGSTITLTGGTSGAVFTGNGTTTMTESFNFLALPDSDFPLTKGYVSFDGVSYLNAGGPVANLNVFVGNAGNTNSTATGSAANVGIGSGAMANINGGQGNVAIGYLAMAGSPNSGFLNVIVGAESAPALLSGNSNTVLGSSSLLSLLAGNENIVIGSAAGSQLFTSESRNIIIDNDGVTGDNFTIRIGDITAHVACYIQGIAGVTTSNSQFVTIDTTTGQLGSQVGGGSGIGTIDGDTSSVSGGTVTLTGGTSGAVFTGDGSTTMTESFNFLSLPDSDAALTEGYISFGGAPYFNAGGPVANQNIFIGGAGNTNSAIAGSLINIGIGAFNLTNINGGTGNIAIGNSAMSSASPISGSENIVIGTNSGGSLETGNNNIILGSNSVTTMIVGQSNIIIGAASGNSYTLNESNNILIYNDGIAAENDTIRIGDIDVHVACYIQGIAEVATSNSQMVTIDTTSGQLGSYPIGTAPVSYTGIVFADSPYTVLATDYYISADVTGGAISVLLPNAPVIGTTFVVKDKVGQALISNITVTTVGGTVNIDGATTFVINMNYQSIQLIFNGTSYEIY